MVFNHDDKALSFVDVEIDGITPCLIHRLSGERYHTVVDKALVQDLSHVSKNKGWSGFDWKSLCKNHQLEVYKLMVQGDATIQGLICLEVDENWVEVHLVESAPWNIGSSNKEFIGVGAHLFAIACRRSFELGFEGFVSFRAKTSLIEHYVNDIGAYLMHPRQNRMVIETARSRYLVDNYFGEGL